jgi:hypothetical protein
VLRGRDSGIFAVPAPANRAGTLDRNRRLTLPSFARQRGHSSLDSPGAGLNTVSRQLGQFRYAMGWEA